MHSGASMSGHHMSWIYTSILLAAVNWSCVKHFIVMMLKNKQLVLLKEACAIVFTCTRGAHTVAL